MTTTEPNSAAQSRTEADAPPDQFLVHLDPPLPRLQLHLLLRNGYETVTDVSAVSDEELLEILGLGEASVTIIRAGITGGEKPPPAQHTPLEELTGRMPSQLRARLTNVGFRTVEEVAGANHNVLKALVPAAPDVETALAGHATIPELRTIHADALTYLANKYTIAGTTTLPARQTSELVALLGQLALYADADNDTALARRTNVQIRQLAPGFPTPWNPARPRDEETAGRPTERGAGILPR